MGIVAAKIAGCYQRSRKKEERDLDELVELMVTVVIMPKSIAARDEGKIRELHCDHMRGNLH
jgi:hypothetical protein